MSDLVNKDFVIENGVLVKYTGNDTEVVIPDGVTSISSEAFSNPTYLINSDNYPDCIKIKSITIPDSVKSIEWLVFEDCWGLESVHIADIAAWCNINFEGEDSNPLRYADNLYINGELATNVVIPDGVTTIGDYAFFNYTSLTSVTIPDSVASIGRRAFEGCKNLTSITIPDSVTTIGDYAFHNCTSLTSITIPDSTTNIGNFAFFGCENLTSITIGKGVPSINTNIFCDCANLKEIHFMSPDTVITGDIDKYLPNADFINDYDTGKSADKEIDAPTAEQPNSYEDYEWE